MAEIFLSNSDKAEAQHVETASVTDVHENDHKVTVSFSADADNNNIYTFSSSETDDSFYSIKDVICKSKVILPLVIFCNFGIIAYGYDNMILSMVLNFMSFEMQFGEMTAPGEFIIPAYWQSLWNALAQIGTMLGSLSSGFLKDKLGRKYTFTIGSIFSIVGTAVIYTAKSPGVYLAGKMVNAIGLGIVQAAGQTYVAEICPTRFRGTGLGIYGIGFGLGSLLGSVVAGKMLGLYYAEEYGYKACFASQWAWGGALLLGSLIMPESPYFHVKNGNMDKARKQLCHLHGKSNTRIIDVTLNHLKEVDMIEKMRSHENVSYMECFRGVNWRRTRIILYANGFNQMIGSTILGNAAYFLTTAGLTTSRATMIIQIGSSFGLLTTILVLVAMSYIGRRPLILGSTLLNVLVYLVMGICSAFKGSHALLGVGFSLMLVYITMGPAVSPLMTVASEVPAMRLRAKSMAIGFGFNYFFSTVMNVVVPYMFNADEGNLGGKIGWVFFGTSVIALIIMWFEIPETKERHFTDLDELFDLRVPTREFSTYQLTNSSSADRAISNSQSAKESIEAV